MLYHGMRDQMVNEKRVHEVVDIAMAESWSSIDDFIERCAALIGGLVAEGQHAGEFGPGDPAMLGMLALQATIIIHHPTMIAQCMGDDPNAEAEAIIAFALRALTNKTSPQGILSCGDLQRFSLCCRRSLLAPAMRQAKPRRKPRRVRCSSPRRITLRAQQCVLPGIVKARLAIVFFTAPLGIVGASIALNLAHMPFGFVALLGLIALAGMDMRNTVILDDQIETEVRELGLTRREAIVSARQRRAPLVALTALAAILAMIPLSESAFWGPMAVTIMGGLSVARFLTLFVRPSIYAPWFRRSLGSQVERQSDALAEADYGLALPSAAE